MRLASIVKRSVMNGPGVRLVAVSQGCHYNCPGCHSQNLRSKEGGVEMTAEEFLEFLDPETTGITLSGGEPLLQLDECVAFLKAAKEKGLHTMLYTGMQEEVWFSKEPNICEMRDKVEPYLDMIKIGPFDECSRNTVLMARGSSNQTVYELQRFTSDNEDGERSFIYAYNVVQGEHKPFVTSEFKKTFRSRASEIAPAPVGTFNGDIEYGKDHFSPNDL